MPAPTADDFWEFSIRVYGTPDVEPACLNLQDEFGLNVNLILYCCWAGSLGVRLERDQLDGVIAAVAEWQRAVVLPLRGVRRQLKETAFEGVSESDRESVRNMVKAAELRSEKTEQIILAGLIADEVMGTADIEAMKANLENYWELKGSGEKAAAKELWDIICRNA